MNEDEVNASVVIELMKQRISELEYDNIFLKAKLIEVREANKALVDQQIKK